MNGDPYHINGNENINTRNYNTETWGSGLLYTLWNHVLTFWKLRNDEVAAIYKLRGMTKEHFQLIRLALIEANSGSVGYQHREWMEQTEADFQRMDVSSIKTWIRRFKKAKRSFIQSEKQGQQHLNQFTIGTCRPINQREITH